MPENEFEKQVKELMEELKFSPTAPVWKKIKKSLHEKKRRVWPIFFLLTAAVGLGGYFFYTDLNHTEKITSKNEHTVTLRNDTINNVLKIEKNKNDVTVLENKNDVTQTQKTSINKQKIDKTNNIKESKNFARTESPKKYIAVKNKKVNNNFSSADVDTSKNINTTAENNILKSNQSITTTQNNNTQIQSSSTIDSINQPKKDIASENKNDSSTINHSQPGNNSTAVKKSKTNKVSKWSFGITAMYGSSGITNGKTHSEKSSAAPNPNGVSVFGINPNISTNPYHNNTAYNVGIVIQRKILKQSAINTGLNFIHLSAKSNTARSTDSSTIYAVTDLQSNYFAASFYRIGSVKTYTNNFNFIELPVTFQSSIFHTKKLSLLYDAGATIRRLISSDALVYDNHNNSLFSNNDLFRKTQFQLTAGLSLQFNLKNQSSILLGPNFQYSLSRYLNTNDYNKLHFMNYGLKASWLFKK